MSRLSRFAKITAGAAAAALLLAGCANAADDTAADSKTVTEGKLTIATGEPAYEPWVLNNDPESGEGLEAAVAYAVAEELGYAKEDVVWVRETFESSIAPGAKDWDLNIQQFTITEERKEAVDFSEPYYTTTQAVVAAAGTAAAGATDLAGLKDAVIGVAAGTTALGVVEATIEPNTEVRVFNSVDDTVAALQAGQIDALVTDLPSAYYVQAVQLEGAGSIVGQLIAEGIVGEDNFGFVLPKGSKLTADVDAALKTLKENGTLDELAAKWLAEQGAPVLK